MRLRLSWPQLIPFVNTESVAHTCITPITYGDQIFDRCFTTLAFWNVVARMEIECINMVLAPCNGTFYFEYMTGFLHPDLFFECFRDRFLLILLIGGSGCFTPTIDRHYRCHDL